MVRFPTIKPACFLVFLSFVLVAPAAAEPPEDVLIRSARESLQQVIDRYLAARRPEGREPLQVDNVVKELIGQRVAGFESDLAASGLGGDDVASRAYNTMLERKKRLAEEKLYLIREAVESGDPKLLRREAIEQLHSDLQQARSKILGVISMQIDDDPEGKEPFTLGQLIEESAKSFWDAKFQLELLEGGEGKDK